MACSSTPPIKKIFEVSETELAELKLAYYSDYFSFVGQDEVGKVAFAIDNNRGQDQETWQADHFVVMHVENQGWQALKGNGLYPNPEGKMEEIPNSEFFSFEGKPYVGMTIRSDINDLVLKIDPIQVALKKEKGLSQFHLGTAKATLKWKGRTIQGRVIHEFLYLPAFNRLSRKYLGVFKDFHGIYAVIGQKDDFYFHLQKNEILGLLIGLNLGFVVINGIAYELENVHPTIKDRTWTKGFYRWPTGWVGAFKFNDSSHKFSLDLQEKNIIANWVIGGFAMGIVTGEIEIDGKKVSVYGLGELIL